MLTFFRIILNHFPGDDSNLRCSDWRRIKQPLFFTDTSKKTVCN